MGDKQALNSARTVLKSKLTKFITKIEKSDVQTIKVFQYKDMLESFNNLRQQADDNYEALLNVINPDSKESLLNNWTECDEKLEIIQEFLAECHERFKQEDYKEQLRLEEVTKELEVAKAAASRQGQGSTTSNLQKPKLPQLTLPTFDGKYEDWLSFRDRYNQAVHSRTDLSSVEKFQYLLAQVNGTPKDVIKTLPLDDGNYMVAYNRIVKLYENKREIAFSIVDNLLAPRPMGTRSSGSILAASNRMSNAVKSLQSLDNTVNVGELFCARIIARELDGVTLERYYQTLVDTSIPPLQGLLDFLDKEMVVIQTSSVTPDSSKTKIADKSKTNDGVPTQTKKEKIAKKCVVCSDDHLAYRCPKLTEGPEKERKKLAEKAKLCLQCLSLAHEGKDCRYLRKCAKCNEDHHTLLHSCFSKTQDKSNHLTSDDTEDNITLKPTAIVNVANHEGKEVGIRALVDNCSDVSYIKESVVRELGLTLERLANKRHTRALGDTHVHTVTHIVIVEITSKYDPTEKFFVTANVINKICGSCPPRNLDASKWNHLPKYNLADPEYFKSRPVDMLLAGDVYYDTVTGVANKGATRGLPVASESAFGWLIGGGTNTTSSPGTCLMTENYEEQLQKFFEVEHGPFEKPLLTKEEEECERHYQETTVRLASGTYEVQLPFKLQTSPLGDSRNQAMRRFYSLENKLERDLRLKDEYVKTMKELIQDGHIEVVSEGRKFPSSESSYYLPHHAVIKDSSTTTKLRVVFDASAKTSHGNSLNDQLMIGPVLQQDLISILMRWRYWIIPLSSDIKQMYLFIEVNPKDRDYLRIFWRESSKDPITTYRMRKVTFGTASAPYQAVKTLFRLAMDHKEKFPLAAKVLERDFYVDDCLTGANSIDEAKELYTQLMAITGEANFILRKWSTSNSEVLETIPSDLRETSLPLTMDKKDSTKALGLVWTPLTDDFRFLVRPSPTPCVTKRRILSEIAKVFDPLGFLSPVTIRAKMIMQAIWKCEKTGWDSRVPGDILHDWVNYQEDMKALERPRIPRCINELEPISYQLHGFSDASERAYAAAVYLRVLTSGGPRVRLVAAKTRVASVKGDTIPRLELCGAVLLAQLMTSVRTALDVIDVSVYAWTDSTITLAWIQSQPQTLKTFIRNRVITILQHISVSCWSHVPGTQNPADLPSRGALAVDLVNSDMWWRGPEFLRGPDFNPKPFGAMDRGGGLTRLTQEESKVMETERKKETTTILVTKDSGMDLIELFSRYSLWTTLRRMVAWWIRMGKVCLHMTCPRGLLSPEELLGAEERIIYVLQRRHYWKEVQALEEGRELSKKSTLIALAPFMKDGLIRVGGRISKADLAYDNRHPILLPKGHVADLIMRRLHLQMLHAGPTLLLSLLQRRYWMVRGKSQVKRIVNRCHVCVIQRAQSMFQLMGDLPEPRVKVSEPFTHTGLDYAGPIALKESSLKKARIQKAYIAVFVCFSTKAVTLELVSELTSEAFRAALHRFVSRRRWPTSLNSDNGTTFVGAAREIEEVRDFLMTEDFETEVVKFLSDRGTEWKFIPPHAPHMGGLWEAAVKSAKFHLKRAIGKSVLTYEQYDTLLKQVEACLNSRPLCATSSDPSDLTPLTPGHFLTGYPPGAVPELDIRELKVGRLDRWQHVQLIKQHFWDRWQSEYLHLLQRRTKWKSTQDNIQIGDLVVVRDDQHPPQFWKTARVVEIHPNQDDERRLVRTVTVRTSSGTYKRPITKLVLLPRIEDKDQNEDEEEKLD